MPKRSHFMVVLIVSITSCQASSLGALWWLWITSCLSSGTLFIRQPSQTLVLVFVCCSLIQWLKYGCLWLLSPSSVCYLYLSVGDGCTFRKWQWIALVISRWPLETLVLQIVPWHFLIQWAKALVHSLRLVPSMINLSISQGLLLNTAPAAAEIPQDLVGKLPSFQVLWHGNKMILTMIKKSRLIIKWNPPLLIRHPYFFNFL